MVDRFCLERDGAAKLVYALFAALTAFFLNLLAGSSPLFKVEQVEVRFEPPSVQPLAEEDILVVLGPDSKLDEFEAMFATLDDEIDAVLAAASEE